MKKIFIGVGIAVVAILGIGTAAYFGKNVFLPSGSVLSGMQKNMAKIESVRFEGSLMIEGKGKIALAEAKSEEYLGGMGGGMVEEDEGEIKEGKIDLKFSGAIANMQDEERIADISLDADFETEDGAGSADLDVKSLEDAVYVKIGELNLAGGEAAGMFDMIIGPAQGKWLKLDAQGVSEKDASLSEEELSAADMEKAEKIKELAEDANIFDYSKELGTEEVRGQSVVKIEVEPRRKDIKNLFKEIYDIQNDGEEYPEVKEDELDDMIDALEDLDIYLWVGVSDSYLYKVSVKGQVQNDEGTDAMVDLDLELYDHNKEIELTGPASFMTMEDLASSMFGGMFSGLEGMDFEGDFGLDDLGDGTGEFNFDIEGLGDFDLSDFEVSN